MPGLGQGETMERICIIGCPGSGKSTLAARLASQTGIPAVHLDQLFWKENWVQRTAAEFDELLAEALKQSRWIMDGNFARTLPLRLGFADTLVVYDLPKWRSLLGYFKRLRRYRGQSRPDMTPGCAEKLDWEFVGYILKFKREDLSALQREFPDLTIIRVRSHRQAEDWLGQVEHVS